MKSVRFRPPTRQVLRVSRHLLLASSQIQPVILSVVLARRLISANRIRAAGRGAEKSVQDLPCEREESLAMKGPQVPQLVASLTQHNNSSAHDDLLQLLTTRRPEKVCSLPPSKEEKCLAHWPPQPSFLFSSSSCCSLALANFPMASNCAGTQ